MQRGLPVSVSEVHRCMLQQGPHGHHFPADRCTVQRGVPNGVCGRFGRNPSQRCRHLACRPLHCRRLTLGALWSQSPQRCPRSCQRRHQLGMLHRHRVGRQSTRQNGCCWLGTGTRRLDSWSRIITRRPARRWRSCRSPCTLGLDVRICAGRRPHHSGTARPLGASRTALRGAGKRGRACGRPAVRDPLPPNLQPPLPTRVGNLRRGTLERRGPRPRLLPRLEPDFLALNGMPLGLWGEVLVAGATGGCALARWPARSSHLVWKIVLLQRRNRLVCHGCLPAGRPLSAKVPPGE